MNVQDWALKWRVPVKAVYELFEIEIDSSVKSKIKNFHNETDISKLIILEANQKGMRLWRNNVGATYNENGRFIRYGLANDSVKINKIIKSSDLVGIKPVVITQEYVGKILGQFVCREIKNVNWKFTNTEREQAQLNWINLINKMGGDAAFTNREGSL